MLEAETEPTLSTCRVGTKYMAREEHKIYITLIGVWVLNTLFYNAEQQSYSFLFLKEIKTSMQSVAFSLIAYG